MYRTIQNITAYNVPFALTTAIPRLETPPRLWPRVSSAAIHVGLTPPPLLKEILRVNRVRVKIIVSLVRYNISGSGTAVAVSPLSDTSGFCATSGSGVLSGVAQ
jgi:hypothetical protein